MASHHDSTDQSYLIRRVLLALAHMRQAMNQNKGNIGTIKKPSTKKAMAPAGILPILRERLAKTFSKSTCLLCSCDSTGDGGFRRFAIFRSREASRMRAFACELGLFEIPQGSSSCALAGDVGRFRLAGEMLLDQGCAAIFSLFFLLDTVP